MASQEEVWVFEGYPDILTVDEAAEALRIGFNALYELLNSGKLKAYKNGRVWRIPKESIKEFIANSARINKNQNQLWTSDFLRPHKDQYTGVSIASQ